MLTNDSGRPIKVSVVIVTYNQERYIAQTIESVLNQETSFDYEIVIGEDCSTDRTREIVAEYARNHPNKIRAILAPKNQGAHTNFLETWKSCRGEYVATLDGDDYWTDSRKLQKQADFLDTNSECSICFHKVTMLYPDGSQAISPVGVKSRSNTADLLKNNFISAAATMFRNGLIADVPTWWHDLVLATGRFTCCIQCMDKSV